MVPSSHLRVYQPLDSFPQAEKTRWAAYINKGGRPPGAKPASYRDVAFGDLGRTGVIYPVVAEHAYVRKLNGKWLVCPWRMRFRMLVSLLTFRNNLPYDVADAFVPESEAEKAVDELDRIRSDTPEMRANIATASWHVPIRWFVPFDDSERITTEEHGRLRVRYETDLSAAKTRVNRGFEILRASGLPAGVVQAVADLAEWLGEFPEDSLVELDYATVADLFDREQLVRDRSAGEVWACLEALETGDFAESTRRYAELAAWWGRVQSLETAS